MRLGVSVAWYHSIGGSRQGKEETRARSSSGSSAVSTEGLIANDNDDIGPLFDWMSGSYGLAHMACQALVMIKMSIRSTPSRASAAKHSANPRLDNCFRDYAQRSARELAELLRARQLLIR